MRGNLSFSLAKFTVTSLSSKSTATKTGSSENASSGTQQRDLRSIKLLMRHQTVTCISTIDNDEVSQPETSLHTKPITSYQGLSDDPTQYAHPSRRLSEGGDSGQGATKNGYETVMTDSALIAHTYRMSQSQDYREMSDHTICTDEKSPIDGGASCSQPRPAVWHPTAGKSEVFQGRDEELSTRAKKSYQLHDMLCSISPLIVDNTPTDKNGHEVLRHHRRTPHTIVLDSHCPQLAPHIVITPPDTWDALYVAGSNRVGYQTFLNLTVPPFFRSTCRMHTYEEWMAIFYPPPPPEQDATPYEAPVQAPVRTPGAQRVFSHFLFQVSIQRAEHERLFPFTRDIAFVNHRRLYKVTVIAASLRAEEFRIRYGSPGFLESVEKPYRWTDPADPILSSLEKCRGAHVIHSVDPFLVPHIVIQETEPNDPWTVWANATNTQDLAAGNLLVVSSSKVSLTYISVADGDGDDYLDEDVDRESFLSDLSSRCDSPYPETPGELERVGTDFLSEDAEEDISDWFYQEYPDYPCVSEEEPPSSFSADDVKCPSSPRSKFFILDEDEDDGPPDFDDWFITIAKRAKEAEEAEAVSTDCS